ncbi:unnamed protein product [Amaranthus hypochondriacus]
MEINIKPAMKDDHRDEQSFAIRNDQPLNNTVKASSKDHTIENQIQVLGFDNNNHFMISQDFGIKTKKAKPKRVTCQVKQIGEKFWCSLCDKQFKSEKAVYGHFRCHKESEKTLTLSERSKRIPKKKKCLRIERLNPIICIKKRSLRKRRTCNFNNPYSLFDSKSLSSSSLNDDNVDEKMLEGAETLLLLSSKPVVFNYHNHVSDDDGDGSRKRKREEEEDEEEDEGLIKPFKTRRLNQTHDVSNINGDDDNENGRFKRFYGLEESSF